MRQVPLARLSLISSGPDNLLWSSSLSATTAVNSVNLLILADWLITGAIHHLKTGVCFAIDKAIETRFARSSDPLGTLA